MSLHLRAADSPFLRRTRRPQYLDRNGTTFIVPNLVGLTTAMFLDETDLKLDPMCFTILNELDRSPDPDAGLYIRARSGKIVKVAIPKQCLAFQIGEGRRSQLCLLNFSTRDCNCWQVKSRAAFRQRQQRQRCSSEYSCRVHSKRSGRYPGGFK